MPSRVSLVKLHSYRPDRVAEACRELLGLLGGVETFVSPGQRVLLKPNLLSAKPPERGVTTHPALIRAVALEVRRAGAQPVLGDSPAGAITGVEKHWQATGMLELARELKIELVSLERAGVVAKRVGSRVYHVSRAVADADVVVNLPRLKTHNLTLLTLGIKNMFGVIPGLKKAAYHKEAPHPEAFSRILVDIFSAATPGLTILDAVTGMEGRQGPASGPLRPLGFIGASSDTVALDAAASSAVGLEPLSVPTTRIAFSRGLGEARLERIHILGTPLEDLRTPDFDIPSNLLMRLVPTPLVHLLGRFLWAFPAVDVRRCRQCEGCVRACPMGAMVMDGTRPQADRAACISCLCCLEVCPEDAIAVQRSALARLIH